MKILISLLLFFNYLSIFSQEKKDEYRTLVDSAISIQANRLYRDYNEDLKVNQRTENWNSHLQKVKKKINNLYLVGEDDKPYFFLKDYPIKFKNIDLFKKQNKKQIKKGLNVWKIHSRLQDNRLIVEIIDFLVTYKKGYIFSNGGGSKTIFEYSCKENKWILVSSAYKGI